MSDLFQIHVRKTVYKAGDTVSGSIRLTNTNGDGLDMNIESIFITFTGRLTATRY